MAKRALNEMKWHPEKSLFGVVVTYLHRGAPGDRLSIDAEEIVRLEKSFFILMRKDQETSIPFHRILEIRQNDKLIWKKV